MSGGCLGQEVALSTSRRSHADGGVSAARDSFLVEDDSAARARKGLTIAGVVVIGLSFGFSFMNITRLGLHLKLPWFLAGAVAPTVFITVAAVIFGLRYLSVKGLQGSELWPARVFVIVTALMEWGLNTALAFVEHNWGMVVFDSIAPVMLLWWAEILPWFLRQFAKLEATVSLTGDTSGADTSGADTSGADTQAGSASPEIHNESSQASASPAPLVLARPGAGRLALATVPTSSVASISSSRRRGGSRRRSGRSRRDEMEAWVRKQWAAGRDPSGADLDREFGTNSYGRVILREMREARGGGREQLPATDHAQVAEDNSHHEQSPTSPNTPNPSASQEEIA
jgi:hypothetical protein